MTTALGIYLAIGLSLALWASYDTGADRGAEGKRRATFTGVVLGGWFLTAFWLPIVVIGAIWPSRHA